MSRSENNWYRIGLAALAYKKALRPSLKQLAITSAICAALYFAIERGLLERLLRPLLQYRNSAAFVPLGTLIILGPLVGLQLMRGYHARRVARIAYREALRQSTPHQLVQLVARIWEREGKWAPADTDAFSASARAVGHALYGDVVAARGALAELNWETRAPIVQSAGLTAEAHVALLCHRDVASALELHERAQSLAAIKRDQGDAHPDFGIALCQCLEGTASPAQLALLERSAKDERVPAVQLLACMGLAAAMEVAGNESRARELRAFLIRVAPHCGALQQTAGSFSDAPPVRAPLGPVSSLLGSPVDSTPSAAQRRTALRRVLGAVGGVALMWAVLLIFFFAIRLLTSP